MSRSAMKMAPNEWAILILIASKEVPAVSQVMHTNVFSINLLTYFISLFIDKWVGFQRN